MLAKCEKRQLTAAQRRCLATAKDLTALAAALAATRCALSARGGRSRRGSLARRAPRVYGPRR